MPDYKADRHEAILWAQGLLSRSDWVIFDTETTGLRGAEIVQIGLLSGTGEVLMDSLVHSHFPIPKEATAIHGITDEMSASAPTLNALLYSMGQIMQCTGEVVVFNAGFDKGILHGCLRRRFDYWMADKWISMCRWTCAMEMYSQFIGDWSSYHRNYRFQKLPGGDHTAIGDCKATLDVIKMMAEAT